MIKYLMFCEFVNNVFSNLYLSLTTRAPTRWTKVTRDSQLKKIFWVKVSMEKLSFHPSGRQEQIERVGDC